MIDSSIDPSYAAFERDQARREAARSAPLRPRHAEPAGALSALPSSPFAARGPSGSLAVETSSSVAVPPPEPAPREAADPLVHLRLARLGFAAVAALVLFALWARQRRTG